MFRFTPISIAAVLLLIAPACALGDDQTQGVEFFEKQIRPLLVERCYKCHGQKKQESELRLDGYAAMLAGGASGPAVVPGKPEASLLVTAVSYQDADLQMPPDKRLSDAQIADLRRWVELGAPHPRGDLVQASQPDEASARSEAVAFWAFHPLKRPVVPNVKNRTWPRNEIDAFVLAGLEAADLAPAPPADPRTLIRRMYFDLIGLPPSPEEVSTWTDRLTASQRRVSGATDAHASGSPLNEGAVRALVDRLLASPHYGEKWGRHWLDIARYADSNGLDENVAHGNAWRYRDYVIAAFNNDKPYDEFVTEQLAGDLVATDDAGERNERLVATGFLSLGPKVLAEVDERKMEMDIIDEQIDTVGKAFLGLTLGCARCHNHKFDPITQYDYYALAGIFKSTHTMDSFTKIAKWHENELWSGDYERQKQQYDGQLADAKSAVEQFVARANDELHKQLGEAAQFPEKPEPSYPQETRDQLKQLRDRVAALEKTKPQPPTAMGVQDGTATDVAIHIRGSHLTLGETTRRGFPTALAGDEPAAIGGQQSGRLQLARWLTSPNTKAGALAARVMVNRVWRWHFGRGLVATTDNFGKLGERPTNAALLDWLADEFVRSGWSIKSLHRTIMLSSAYRMSSRFDERSARVDPENRRLWRMDVRRLDAEQFRDALLAVSGKLDRSMGGSLLTAENRKHIFDHTSRDETNYGTNRRSVYLPVVRNHLCDAFTLFDYTDASTANGSRNSSTVTSQALYVMNSDFVAESAATLAGRILAEEDADAERIRLLYEIAYSRSPTEAELDRLLQSLGQAADQFSNEAEPQRDPRRRAWEMICHAVLASNEFIYIQ